MPAARRTTAAKKAAPKKEEAAPAQPEGPTPLQYHADGRVTAPPEFGGPVVGAAEGVELADVDGGLSQRLLRQEAQGGPVITPSPHDAVDGAAEAEASDEESEGDEA